MCCKKCIIVASYCNEVAQAREYTSVCVDGLKVLLLVFIISLYVLQLIS